VLNDLSPDIVVMVEGPNRTGEVELFFNNDVDGRWKVHAQHSKGQSQNVCVAVRIDQDKFSDPPFSIYDTNNITAFDPFVVDTDDDEIKEQHKFERRPLYVEINPSHGFRFRILGLHLKSKGIFKSYEWSKWWQMAEANRKKLLAQTTQLRLEFLDPFLTEDNTRNIPLIVCGDVNDGPGLDASEKRLYGSAIERLMGTVWKPALCLNNALFDELNERARNLLDFSAIKTTSFKDPIFNYMWHQVWIDHILYSGNQAWQWVESAAVHSTLPDGSKIWETYKHASDHFPISAVIKTEDTGQ
jgi:endonuclease/exonuclease/phosphatase family metal-dependent hydrolase